MEGTYDVSVQGNT